ncbi:MAG: hypothetical protein Q9187_003829 [Circinaria calcarea]
MEGVSRRSGAKVTKWRGAYAWMNYQSKKLHVDLLVDMDGGKTKMDLGPTGTTVDQLLLVTVKNPIFCKKISLHVTSHLLKSLSSIGISALIVAIKHLLLYKQSSSFRPGGRYPASILTKTPDFTISNKMQLLDLPAELLELLPYRLSSLQDLYSLLRTCRVFYRVCESSKATLPPAFPKLHGQSLLPPHPHLLLAGVARQVADWAVQSDENRAELYETLLLGNEGLLNLATQVARLSLEDIRTLYAAKGDLLHPLIKMVDREAGHERFKLESLRQGIDLSPWDCLNGCENPEIALLNYWIYCELFHHNVDHFLAQDRLQNSSQPLSNESRLRWFTYCVPDGGNQQRPDWSHINEYQQCDQTEMWTCRSFVTRLRTLVQFWSPAVLSEIGEDIFGDPYSRHMDYASGFAEGKLSLFLRMAVHLGKDSLEMLLPDRIQKLMGRLEALKRKVESLNARDIPQNPEDDSDEWWSMKLDCYHGTF